MRNQPRVPLTKEVIATAMGASFTRQLRPLPRLHRADTLLSRAQEAPPLVGRTDIETALLVKVARWSQDFLTKPHVALGRSGPVCPYVGAAIRAQRFLLTTIRVATTSPEEIDETLLRLGQFFLRLNPTGKRMAHRKTIVIVFPDLPGSDVADVINGIHQRLKPDFLRRGMMLGEFYRDSGKPGLHNPDFRPLRSDTPLLVIRTMMPTDIAFLGDKASFVRAFLENFGARGCAEIRSYLTRRGASLSTREISMMLKEAARVEAATSGVHSSTDSRCPVHRQLATDGRTFRAAARPAAARPPR